MLKITSYDNIWQYWGFDCTPTTVQVFNPKTGKTFFSSKRNGNFHIFKLKLADCENDLQSAITIAEVKHNRSQQLRKIADIEKKNQRAARIVCQPNLGKSALIKDIIFSTVKQQSIRYNTDISCKKLSELLGYKTQWGGWKAEYRAQFAGMCKILKNKPILVPDIKYHEGIEDLIPSNCFVDKSGNIWRLQCNSIILPEQ
jgi:hypothetical protein